MEWKRNIRDGVACEAQAQVGTFRLSVHHYMGLGDTWFASCYGVFDRHELGNMSLNDAQVMAAAKLQLVLEEALKTIIGESLNIG